MRALENRGRARWQFPFCAEYISVLDGETLVQHVTVMERFGGSYSVTCDDGLRVAYLKNPVPSGVSELVPTESVREH